jgi:predicted nucleic acid-binding protein
MILVDTSVFINYFKGVENESTLKLDNIISENITFGINNYIFQELLQGSSNEKEFNTLFQYLSVQTFYSLKGKQSYADAALLYFKCRKQGVTIRSTIDLLIAQTAIENDLFLLHYDNDFVNMSKIITNLKLY